MVRLVAPAVSHSRPDCAFSQCGPSQLTGAQPIAKSDADGRTEDEITDSVASACARTVPSLPCLRMRNLQKFDECANVALIAVSMAWMQQTCAHHRQFSQSKRAKKVSAKKLLKTGKAEPIRPPCGRLSMRQTDRIG